MLKVRIFNDALDYLMIFASILLFKDGIIMDGVKSNGYTGDKGHHKL